MDSPSGKLNLPDGTGRAGEAAARNYVVGDLGFNIVATNYRTRGGEVDIVATDSDSVVFVEVKTRTNHAFGSGVEQISRQKAHRLQAVAMEYLAESGLENSDWRIDLLVVEMDRSGRVLGIDHVESAIEELE